MTINLKRLKAERIASGMTQDEVAHPHGVENTYSLTQSERMVLYLLVLTN